MTIYDTVHKQKIPFEPLESNKVRIYLCGPTVYDDSHLGHARSAISFDLFRRVLTALGYDVTFMRNITDIDDKIIRKMEETEQSLQELTEFYTQSYLNDMDALGVLRPSIEPKATENLDIMGDMIQEMMEKGFAYQVSSGDVYFDVSKEPSYGSVSQRVEEEEQLQSRVAHDEEKHNFRDFALWKACAEGEEVCFDSPVGKGRPGWHTECVAMIDKHLSTQGPYAIDVHAGGADLLFPHHENEAAQMHACRSRVIAKYWMHNGFVKIDGEKMSKSLNNSFFIKDALRHYPGEALRFYLMSSHYRAPLNFSEEDMLASKKRLDKLYRLKKRLFGVAASEPEKTFKANLLDALKDDLNISVAVAHVDEMVSAGNELLDNKPKDKGGKKALVANLSLVEQTLGVGMQDPYAYFQFGVDEVTRVKVESLIKARNAAKKEKNFEEADRIRDEILALEISIMDTPGGTVWERT